MLLSKNEIKAVKKLVFTIVWAIREQRLHSYDTQNIKLDGRPLGGVYIANSLYINLEFIALTEFI